MGAGTETDSVTEVSDSSAPQACTGTATRTANTTVAVQPSLAPLTEAFPWLLERMSIYLDNGTRRGAFYAPRGSGSPRAANAVSRSQMKTRPRPEAQPSNPRSEDGSPSTSGSLFASF